MSEISTGQSSGVPPTRDKGQAAPPQEGLSDSLMCLLWRCLRCGAAQLGTIDEKPEQCKSCGGRDFEFVEED